MSLPPLAKKSSSWDRSGIDCAFAGCVGEGEIAVEVELLVIPVGVLEDDVFEVIHLRYRRGGGRRRCSIRARCRLKAGVEFLAGFGFDAGASDFARRLLPAGGEAGRRYRRPLQRSTAGSNWQRTGFSIRRSRRRRDRRIFSQRLWLQRWVFGGGMEGGFGLNAQHGPTQMACVARPCPVLIQPTPARIPS